MRLYSQVGADSHVTPDGTRYTPDKAGGFDFPDEVSDAVGGFAVKGKRLWETEEDRADRMHGMEMARRRDPASMLTVMEENAALVRQLTELTAALAAAQLGKQAVPVPAVVPAAPAPGDEPEPAPAVKPARAPKTAAKTAPSAA